MNKNIRNTLIFGFVAIVSQVAVSCPITLENNNTVPVWVVTAELANMLKDVATSANIRKMAQDNNIDSTQYKRLKVGSMAAIGDAADKNYYVYVKVPNTKSYIRLFQVHLTQCIAPKEKAMWWKNNYLSLSQLKNGTLTPEQSKHLSVTVLRSIFGYKYAAAYTELLTKLKDYWKAQQKDDEEAVPEASTTTEVSDDTLLDFPY